MEQHRFRRRHLYDVWIPAALRQTFANSTDKVCAGPSDVFAALDDDGVSSEKGGNDWREKVVKSCLNEESVLAQR